MVVKRGRDLTEEKEKNQFETFGEREGEQRCKDQDFFISISFMLLSPQDICHPKLEVLSKKKIRNVIRKLKLFDLICLFVGDFNERN